MSTLWQKYRTLPTKTRIAIGTGIMAYALFAQQLTDKAEEPLGLHASETDKERLWAGMPKIRTVDRAGTTMGTDGVRVEVRNEGGEG